ncbi:MAG: hypothetical protein JNK63_11570 [Chthonomonas sp.]|nr:hypothetical protein [Chthonomonas sp.]
MMKNILAGLLLLSIALVSVGCSGGDEPMDKPTGEPPQPKELKGEGGAGNEVKGESVTL